MKRIGVLTSGGDSPGMNAGIRAVVRAGIHQGLEVVGIHRGYQGMIDGEMNVMGPRSVSGIINRGGTILHSARCMAFKEPEGRAQAAAQLKKHEIEGIVVIGGDGSYRGAHALYTEHGIACIGLPGTIDNDIGGTEYTIGFDTAINTAMEAIDRVRDTAAAHDRNFFVEVMGRHSGYISMITAIAGGAEEVLVPETPTDIPALVELLREGQRGGKTSMIVVVAEGDDAGNALEIAQKVANISEFKNTRVTIIGHLQRGGSPTAFDRVLASRMGVRAVEALLEGESGKMVGIRNQHMILCRLSEAWKSHTQFDPKLLNVLRILGT
ncbi:MAG: 6-phosphofructokinase [Candidatus Hydrogenedentes bacterium]|nr:6-phosphofructokinase [Candidatus Hydrogenedentota bacterium]